MSVLDSIIARNSALAARPLDAQPKSKLCVVTCTDPSVAGVLQHALGFEPGEALIIALPGPAIRGGGEELCCAVASAVALNGCEEVLVVAHSDCSLVATQSSAAASALASRGFDRSRLPQDVRSFFNLQASPRQIAVDTAGALRAAPYMPAGLLVHAALLDCSTGLLTVLERGENQMSAAAAGASGSFGKPGPTSFEASLPEGLGIGVSSTLGGETRGPTELKVELPPAPHIEASSLDLMPTELLPSSIDLTPSKLDIAATPLEPAALPIGLEVPVAALSGASGGAIGQETEATPAPNPAPPPMPRSRPRPPSRSRPVESTSGRPARESPLDEERFRIPAELVPKVEKVRDFYVAELSTNVRVEIGRSLTWALAQGASTNEMIKLAFKPVLESGPKRYRVIDELLAIKDAANQLSAENCCALLRQLVG